MCWTSFKLHEYKIWFIFLKETNDLVNADADKTQKLLIVVRQNFGTPGAFVDIHFFAIYNNLVQ